MGRCIISNLQLNLWERWSNSKRDSLEVLRASLSVTGVKVHTEPMCAFFFYFSLSIHKTIQSRCICIALTVPLDSFPSAKVQGVRENLFTRQFPHNLLHSLAIFGITKCRKTKRSRSQFTVFTSKWFPFFFYLFHESVHEFV